MGTQERLRILTEKVQVTIDNVILEEDPSRCELLLGCQIQSNLKWSEQVSGLLGKLKKRLAGLLHLKFIVPFRVRKTITEGMFNSVMVYCLPLFGGTDKGHIRSIQLLQNKAAQIVCHSSPRTSRTFMFDKLGWLTVNQLISYHTLISVFKIKNSREPEYLAEILNNENRNERIIITNQDLTLTARSFTFRGSAQWNILPQELRKTTKISAFKRELRKWVFGTIPRFID